MCQYTPELIEGLTGGISAGFGIWILNLARRKYWRCENEKRILRFLKENTDFKFRTTHRIASHVNLTIPRVRFICSISTKIKRNEKEKETWELRNSWA